MATTPKVENRKKSSSAFDELGMKETIELLVEEAKALYLADSIPWVVGYSGGKDSTAVLQIVWMAIKQIEPARRHKKVHVISTDTLVENPVVANWVEASHDQIRDASAEQKLPIEPNRLMPKLEDTFWVNLLGKGYPAPRPMFRWCTDRLKISPSNTFIRDVVQANGEAILCLGTRKKESIARGILMRKLETERVREKLSPSQSMQNCYVYSPIEDWSNDDVWMFLMQYKNPWGYNNKDLLTMYQGASPDGECPLVVDSSTPSCGDSRFGCWVCTLVDKDKSMTAMIQNDEEKEWMRPMMQFRDLLDIKEDRKHRDFRRMRGNVQLFHDEPIPGPYVQERREILLGELLRAQAWMKKHGPKKSKPVEIITFAELEKIREIWIKEKHEIEDSLPAIYEKNMGEPYPGEKYDDTLPFKADELALLQDSCGDQRLLFELVRELIDVERKYKASHKRSGLFDDIDKAFKRNFFKDKADATEYARRKSSKNEGNDIKVGESVQTGYVDEFEPGME